MKNLKQKSIVLALAMLVAITVNAQQGKQYNGNKGQQNKGYNQKQCGQKKGKGFYLDLSEEQKSQMKDMKLALQKKMLPLKNELREKKAKMQTLSTAEKVDMKAINALIDEIGVLKTQMAKEKAAHKQEVRNILTEEQRIKFDSRKGPKGKGYGKCHGNGHGKGYGRS